ncbi:response regulator [Paenibacillus sp. 1011MAR3C5]|uniref:ATP-binding response regulator n=1 Tax=Paenibacillus sp. 1011MAR3C5 TaxID=1675787 RepID=UPI000E6C2541|nr:ATP-binding protein [Paenibacillus sp. 1011MAR3C5]RJE85076.1 response regulator [Paenibacillus sp. 1011MAR3C5]
MRRNISLIVMIMMLFTMIFFLGNQNYFHIEHKSVVQDGFASIDIGQLDKQSIIKLDGEWAFYPNVLIPPGRAMSEFEDQRIGIAVPSKWDNLVEPNEEGLSVGTYHTIVEVPVEGQYGLYLRTIRQANRIFINGEEVGAKGNPSHRFETFRVENADKYTVFSASENKLLDIVIHVANYNYSKAGILFQVDFGTKSSIENDYNKKLLLDALVSIGYMIFGLIYLISYYQNRKRKEELFFGLFILLLGIYMSFINQKIFFQFFPTVGVSEQIRLQLGIIPLVAASLTYFVHAMYPEYIKKRAIIRISVLLGIVFFIYAITNPFANHETGGVIFFQLMYVSAIIPVVLYNLLVLFRVLLKEVEGAHYILIFLVSLCCYSILMVVKFLFDLPMDYSELLLFVLVLYSFASLLSFRANASFSKTQKLSEELYINSQLKDEFLIQTSHELRTPLNRILNVSKALMEGTKGPLKREQQENIISIHNDTQRLGFLVEDLLFSSNHMAGEVSVTPRAVPIAVINEVIDEIRSLLSDDVPIRLISAVEDPLPAMYTDELRFKQVLYNLLYNSLQHTTEGHIKVTAEVREEQMVIGVSDTGSGIPPQELEYIFDSFYRVKNERRGFGLGLSIAKNIVEKLNGHIYATSTFGAGSIFTFTMPLAKTDGITDSTTDSTSHSLELPLFYKGNEQTILVVDDDHASIKLLADALTQSGYTFIAVDNGYDALDILNTHKVDCMLIDYMMSGMSGYELCKKVRKHHDILELPIIVLTSIMQHSDLMLSLHSGANDYLLKPIVIEDLLVRIQSLLAVRQSSIDAIEEEMNYLYAQVTPHFVYNTLNTIIALSYKDIKNTRSALYYLSTYFRAKLNVHYRNSMVSISEEIELVKAYLYIEQMRLDDRLTVIYDIDESIAIQIPALSLQPLVENAVFHGISKKKEGGTVEISVKRDGQLIRIKIDDNGVGIPEDKLQQIVGGGNSRIGLKNPLKKFKLIKSASLRLYSEEGKGTTVIILLPGDDRIEHSHH